MSNQSVLTTGCQWYANQLGWTLRRGNVMVEGNTDVRYFSRAAELYHQSSGLHLINKDLSVFSAGSGDEGGTYGISERFPVLHSLAKLDLDGNGKIKYRTIALFDDDKMGREAVRTISKGNRTIQEYAQLFLLRRVMPRKSRDPKPLAQHTRNENAVFGGLDCVIEDLIDQSFCTKYAQQFPQHLKKSRSATGDSKHMYWEQDGKFGLLRTVEQQGSLAELLQLVEILKSLRFYLGLPTDGVS